MVLRKLVKLGYTDARGEMINFVDYGIPQRRSRFVVIATKEGVADDIFSTLEENRQSFLISKNLLAYNTVQDALSDLEKKNGLIECPDSVGFMSGITSVSKNDFQASLRLPSDGEYVPDSHRYVNHTPPIQKIFETLLENAPRDEIIKGTVREQFGVKKRSVTVLDPNKPAHTITTIPDDFIHYSEPRVMTVRECARLQTFPDWFEFKGPYTSGGKARVKQTPRYTQVGNAVPPLFAEQLGIAINQVLG
jgi:DNA (cytosine-5)-methyltransferase 1